MSAALLVEVPPVEVPEPLGSPMSPSRTMRRKRSTPRFSPYGTPTQMTPATALGGQLQSLGMGTVPRARMPRIASQGALETDATDETAISADPQLEEVPLTRTRSGALHLPEALTTAPRKGGVVAVSKRVKGARRASKPKAPKELTAASSVDRTSVHALSVLVPKQRQEASWDCASCTAPHRIAQLRRRPAVLSS